MAEWFMPGREDFAVERAMLFLGMRRAMRYYRELVVPGIGGVWYVRQISWALAGIALAGKSARAYQASQIANGIEALACKLRWYDGKEEGIRGTRAFARYEEAWDFSDLSTRKYYVQVTFRQSTVGALRALGFTSGGVRFNTMVLTDAGREMVDLFLDSERTRNVLERWIDKGALPDSGKTLLVIGQLTGTAAESQLLQKRLLADTIDNIGAPDRRRYLIEAIKPVSGKAAVSLGKVKSQLKDAQRLEIETAEAFDRMLDAARAVVHSTAHCLEARSEAENSFVVRKVMPEIRKLSATAKHYVAKARESKKAHPESLMFADAIVQGKVPQAVFDEVIKRDGAIVSAFGLQHVARGPLFDRRHRAGDATRTQDAERDQADGQALEDSSTKLKVDQLRRLWRNH